MPFLVSTSLVCRTIGSVICDENFCIHFSRDVVEYLFVDFTSIGQIFFRDVALFFAIKKSISILFEASTLSDFW